MKALPQEPQLGLELRFPEVKRFRYLSQAKPSKYRNSRVTSHLPPVAGTQSETLDGVIRIYFCKKARKLSASLGR